MSKEVLINEILLSMSKLCARSCIPSEFETSPSLSKFSTCNLLNYSTIVYIIEIGISLLYTS